MGFINKYFLKLTEAKFCKNLRLFTLLASEKMSCAIIQPMIAPEQEKPHKLTSEEVAVARRIEKARQRVPDFIHGHSGLLKTFGLNHGVEDKADKALLDFFEGSIVEHFLFVEFCSVNRKNMGIARLAFEKQAADNEDLFSDRSKMIEVTLKRALRISAYVSDLTHQFLMENSRHT
jgi:hypothetical protein